MIDWHVLTAVLAVYFLGVANPGPNFIAVVQKATSAGRSHAYFMVLGIAVVSLVWAMAAILGVGLVLKQFPRIALDVKMAGATYLIWYGARLCLVKACATSIEAKMVSAKRVRSFFEGIVTNQANPKSIAVFAAIFASAIPPNVSFQTASSLMVMVLMVELGWYGFVASMLSADVGTKIYSRFRAIID